MIDADALRKIIHIDMDAFYASVEQRDDPGLRGRPVIVGGNPQGRGVVAAASYEAREYGIRSAMPAARAVRLCPHAVFLRPRFDVYREVSRQIHEIFAEFTDRIEPLSLDEAYLDVTGSEHCQGSATLMAGEIKHRVRSVTGLVASAGVSYNKFLAKLASDADKPDGLHVIRPEQAEAFVADLPIGAFHGVGSATEAKMKRFDIHTGRDLRRHSLAQLTDWFGKAGQHYYNVARGIDPRPVRTSRVRKSLGHETTFPRDLADPRRMVEALERLAEKVARDLARRELAGRTVTLKVKYADFRLVTRSQTFDRPLATGTELAACMPPLLARTEADTTPVRLLGITVSALEPHTPENAGPQLSLELL